MNCTVPAIIAILIIIYIISLPSRKENLVIEELKEHLTVVNPHFDKLDIREGSSSYTEDKSVIYLCLRDSQGNLYSKNTLVYVALHEIAHMLNKVDYGHTAEFHRIFEELLCKAMKAGIYNPYIPHPPNYCGVDISGITIPNCSN